MTIDCGRPMGELWDDGLRVPAKASGEETRNPEDKGSWRADLAMYVGASKGRTEHFVLKSFE